MTIMESYTYP